jgi:hypothetical protein
MVKGGHVEHSMQTNLGAQFLREGNYFFSKWREKAIFYEMPSQLS